MKDKLKPFSYPMFLIICILLCFGLITLASASSYSALDDYSDSLYYLKRQLIFAAIGIVVMIVVSRIDYNIYKKVAYFGYIGALLLMAAVFIPGVGVNVNGARRWINLGFTTMQPSEIMKVILVIASSTCIVNNYKKNKGDFIKTYGPIALMLVLVIAVMYFQNHLSGTLVMIVGVVAVVWSGGIKITPKIIAIILIAVLILLGWMLSSEFRRERIMSFFNGDEDIQGSNWQATQSKYAIGTGGVFGLGLGQSRQKYLWLPEAQNDFIFSILAEELGLIGATIVVGLFAAFIIIGFSIAIRCKDLFGSLIASGIITVFAFQIIVNICVVTCIIPVTGMPLPFFSYGGTALLINLASMGILLNVSRNCE